MHIHHWIPVSCFSLMFGCSSPSDQSHQRTLASGDATSSPSGAVAAESIEVDFGFNFATEAPNSTCRTKQTHLMLDLDGDGVVNHYTDGALLLLLMTEGAPEAKKKTFKRPGNRTDVDLYFSQFLSLHLKVTNTGYSPNMFTDGVLISSFMLNPPRAKKDELLKKFGGNEQKIEKLLKTKVACNPSPSFAIAEATQAVTTGNYHLNWGGAGNVWFWSKKGGGWIFADKEGHMRLWVKDSDPAVGQSIGKINQYYLKNPDKFVDLIK